MPLDRFFTSQWIWKDRAPRKPVEEVKEFRAWDRSAYVTILAREKGQVDWRKGEVVSWEERGKRLRQLQDENPTMQFSWQV